MTYYICNEKGVSEGTHNCSSVEEINGLQVCGAVQWQLDYCGHIFCACVCGKKDIDTIQISMFEEIK